MVVLYLIFWLTNLELIKDCALNFDLEYIKDVVVLDLDIKECEISTSIGFDSCNFFSAASRLSVDETMPLHVNDQVLKQDLKVM